MRAPKTPALALIGLCLSGVPTWSQSNAPQNIILFVPDGLRALSVNPQTAPALAGLRDAGVHFEAPHSLFPTFTMPNSSGMATGHQIGDTGAFSNTLYTGYAVPPANGSVTPFIENDAVLGDIDEHFGGNYLNEDTILKLARAKGFGTAAIGKLGPTLQFDHTARTGEDTIVFDDSTGTANGIPLSAEVRQMLERVALPLATPARGENGKAGDFRTPGTLVSNHVQQQYFADAATKVVLPLLKRRGAPFVLVFWSRDPDGTQHNQGDSPNSLTPGITGPTSLAAIRTADDNFRQLQQALVELGLAETTNIIVAADHGFSTISKESHTSTAAKGSYADVLPGQLPPGFVAIDLARALGRPLFDPDSKNAAVAENAYPRVGNGLIGSDPAKPEVVVAANGGSDLIYVPQHSRELVTRVVDVLLSQDYVSGIFVDDAFGTIPGTIPLSAANLKGNAQTPAPSIVISFRSSGTGCAEPVDVRSVGG